jgi:hypothetical protein
MAGEFHRSLRGGGSRHIPMIGSFTGHYVGRFETHTNGLELQRTLRGGDSRHIPRAESFTGHYVGVSRHIPRAGSFTGHYVGEVLDTYQCPAVSQDTTWGIF